MKMFAILRREAVESAIGARLDEEVCLDREEASAVEDGQCAIDRRRGLEIRRDVQQAWLNSRGAVERHTTKSAAAGYGIGRDGGLEIASGSDEGDTGVSHGLQ